MINTYHMDILLGMLKAKKEHTSFYHRHSEHGIKLWLGHPDDPESEFVLEIHHMPIPELIFAL